MIKKFIYPLVAIILLSSCASKFSMQKRKYNKGFYFASSKGNKSKSNEPSQVAVKHTHITTKQVNALPAENHTEKDISHANIITPVTENVKVYSSITAESKKPVTQPMYVSAKKGIENSVITSRKINENFLAQNLTKTKKGGGGAHPIILILCCIFIPFLGVYLFERSITTNFWVDLLLCLLFWLPGIIFAFLVCFAGVSL